MHRIGFFFVLCAAGAPHIAGSQSVGPVPRADQFPGADLCVKLRAADVYAVAHGIGSVDATQFSGAQSCSVDPVRELAKGNAAAPLVIRFGAVHIRTAVPWRITNPGVTLQGLSPEVSWLVYTGAAPVPAILTLQSLGFAGGAAQSDPGPAGNLWSVNVRDLAVVGANGSGIARDAMYAAAWHHAELANVWTWGVSGCGIHTFFAVTDTFYRPRTSSLDAEAFGFGGPPPRSALCFDGAHTIKTTDGTVIDAGTESVKGTGWVLSVAQNMTFSAGTSEGNGGIGVEIGGDSGFNSFTDVDLEGNGSANVVDGGTSTLFINGVMDWKPIRLTGSSKAFHRLGSNITAPIQADAGASVYGDTFGNADLGAKQLNQFRVGPDGRPTIIANVGAPQGACQTGSLYLDTAGGKGKVLYLCENGGWAAK